MRFVRGRGQAFSRLCEGGGKLAQRLYAVCSGQVRTMAEELGLRAHMARPERAHLGPSARITLRNYLERHMQKLRCLCCTLFLLSSVGAVAQAHSPMTWDQVRQRFEQNNPTLMAGKLNIDESKAQEITANLRPNHSASVTADFLYKITLKLTSC